MLTLLVYYRHGAQGVLDGASKSTLENEFGSHNDDECIVKILESGDVQVSEVCSPSPPFTCIETVCGVGEVWMEKWPEG